MEGDQSAGPNASGGIAPAGTDVVHPELEEAARVLHRRIAGVVLFAILTDVPLLLLAIAGVAPLWLPDFFPVWTSTNYAIALGVFAVASFVPKARALSAWRRLQALSQQHAEEEPRDA